MRAFVSLVAVCLAATVHAQQPAAPATPPPDDPIETLVGRLDLEKYKATIKGLTQFGDRRQGTARNRAAVDWIEAQLKSYGCTNTERVTYQYAPPPAVTAAEQAACGRRRRGGCWCGGGGEAAAGGGQRGAGGAGAVETRERAGRRRPAARSGAAQPRPRVARPSLDGQRPTASTAIPCVSPTSAFVRSTLRNPWTANASSSSAPRSARRIRTRCTSSAPHGRPRCQEAVNDDGSGTALVMELARVFNSPDVQTERSIRFALWNNEETGSMAPRLRRSAQGSAGHREPQGSGKYPEPKWLGMIQHDMMMWDHGMPQPVRGADGKPQMDAKAVRVAGRRSSVPRLTSTSSSSPRRERPRKP
jgi:hypothetical protein